MEKENLAELLEELVEQSPLGARELGRLRRLEEERQELKEKRDAIRQHFLRWKKSRATLEHLISEHDFHGQLRALGHPYRVLGGEVNLDSDAQRLALSELAVTLERVTQGRPMVLQITRALNLYYREFFQNKMPPYEEDEKCLAAIASFDKDSKRGQHPSYQRYLEMKKLLAEGGRGTLKVDDPPSYWPILVADAIASKGTVDEKIELFESVQWGPTHVHLLYGMVGGESDEALVRRVLKELSALDVGQHLKFFERQLELKRHGDLIRETLLSVDREKMEALRQKSIEDNCDKVLNMITNETGLDRPLYYQSLKEENLKSDVFSRLVEWLFRPQSRKHYGMDGLYAQEVLRCQKQWPQKVISVLLAMPRGVEGQRLDEALTFFEGLQEQRRVLLDEVVGVDPQREGRRDCELRLSLSDLETARFILFTYIQERIFASKALPKVTGMPHEILAERLMVVANQELEVGPNVNVMQDLHNIWEAFPVLKVAKGAEVS